MAVYESEQEQLEEIKKWWKENGSSVLTGVALGLAILFGWRGWEGYTNGRAEQASAFYEQVLMNLEQNKADQARQVASGLLSEQSNSPYASLAQLNLAAQDLKEGNLDSSHARLQWVMDRNTLPQLSHVARLRKVKLFLSQNKIDEAQKLLNSVADKGRFKATYTVLQGDIAMLQGQMEVARTAYTEALQSDVLAGGEGLFSREEKNLVQMKLDNLGTTKEARIEARLPVSLPAEVPATSATTTKEQEHSATSTTKPTATATPSTAPKEVPATSSTTTKDQEHSATPTATVTPSTAPKQDDKSVSKQEQPATETPKAASEATVNDTQATSVSPSKEMSPASVTTTGASTSGQSTTTPTVTPTSPPDTTMPATATVSPSSPATAPEPSTPAPTSSTSVHEPTSPPAPQQLSAPPQPMTPNGPTPPQYTPPPGQPLMPNVPPGPQPQQLYPPSGPQPMMPSNVPPGQYTPGQMPPAQPYPQQPYPQQPYPQQPYPQQPYPQQPPAHP